MFKSKKKPWWLFEKASLNLKWRLAVKGESWFLFSFQVLTSLRKQRFWKTVKVSVAQLSTTLWDPMDCSLPSSCGHRVLWVKILKWVTMSFSRGISWSRDRTWVSCIASRFLTIWATAEVNKYKFTPLEENRRNIFCYMNGENECRIEWLRLAMGVRKHKENCYLITALISAK